MKYSEFYKSPLANIISNTPIMSSEIGARTCYDSLYVMKEKNKENKQEINNEIEKILFNSNDVVNDLMEYGVEVDPSFINKIGLINKHGSTLEHIVINSVIKIQRNALQELARHRITSLSIQSTRYTLTDIIKSYKNEEMQKFHDMFILNDGISDENILEMNFNHFKEKLDYLHFNNIPLSNDIVKNFIPETWLAKGVLTINLRSLHNLLSLRLNKNAFILIRKLSSEIYQKLPNDIKKVYNFEFDDIIRDISYVWNSEIEVKK